jgi:4-diphosphocytidyl-2-C-methyl-D-erythritol kinase
MSQVHIRSFCKVNLCLEILGRRDDGYHELSTVFQTVSLADELVLQVGGDGIELTVPGGGAPAGPENLCWRAAEAYQGLRGWPEGVRIELRKRVPAGAGLGGGSSNAAAVLNALAALDDQPPDRSELTRLAAELGSDVAFFIEGGTALGRGRGEQLEPLPALTSCWLVLARPELAISTVEAYGMLSKQDFTDGAGSEAMADALRRGEGPHSVAQHIHNGFTRTLAARWPELAELTEGLRCAGAVGAAISGSGSAVFGLFASADEARAAADGLRHEGLWSAVAEPTDRGSEPAER